MTIDTNLLRGNWPHLSAYADEIDRLRGQLVGSDMARETEREAAHAEVATARALAMEEAARDIEGEHRPNCYDRAVPDGETALGPACARCLHAQRLRSLTPLPSSLVAVERGLLERIGYALKACSQKSCSDEQAFEALTILNTALGRGGK